MRRPGGYLLTTGPMGTQEADTFMCVHCNRHTQVKPFARPEDLGGRCTCCNGIICKHCVGKGCDPLEEKLRRAEKLGYW